MKIETRLAGDTHNTLRAYGTPVVELIGGHMRFTLANKVGDCIVTIALSDIAVTILRDTKPT